MWNGVLVSVIKNWLLWNAYGFVVGCLTVISNLSYNLSLWLNPIATDRRASRQCWERRIEGLCQCRRHSQCARSADARPSSTMDQRPMCHSQPHSGRAAVKQRCGWRRWDDVWKPNEATDEPVDDCARCLHRTHEHAQSMSHTDAVTLALTSPVINTTCTPV